MNYFKNLVKSLIECWDILPAGLRSFIANHFRFFRRLTRIVLTSLLFELIFIGADEIIQEFYLYLEYKGFLYLKYPLGLFLGHLLPGFNWLSIIIKLFLVLFFSTLEFLSTKTTPLIMINIFGKKWRPNDEWFKKVLEKHFTRELSEKYKYELFEDQGAGQQVLKLLKELNPYKEQSIKQLKKIRDRLDQLDTNYQEMQCFLEEEDISVNEDSNQFIQLNSILSNIGNIKINIKTQIKILKKDKLESFSILNSILPESIEEARYFDPDHIDGYTPKDQFVAQIPQDPKCIFKVFVTFKELVQLNNNWRNNLLGLRSQSLFFYGKAGVGKSNLAAFLATELSSKDYPVIIIKGSSFRGSPDNFDGLLRRELEVPENYSVLDILKKLNNFGKSEKKRVTIIFDALNETTFQTSGFSPIWRNSLDEFIHQLERNPYLFFIATLRTSYINRIWDDHIPYYSHKLKGFHGENINSVIKKYFKHYLITYAELDPNEVMFLQNPLMLDLYCKMLNPDRSQEIEAVLGIKGFQEVFAKYVSQLKKSAKRELDLPSVELISEGLGRCSDAMMEDKEAMIPIQNYYTLMQGKTVEKVEGTIGQRILNGYLIYLEDSISGRSVVLHSQQQVGGYMLAKRLVENHETIQGVMDSTFFNEAIIVKNGGHQLKDDILQFLTIDAIDYAPFIEKYIENDRIKEFILVKLQREQRAKQNSNLRAKLFASFSSNGDYLNLLSSSANFFTEINSPLRIIKISRKLLEIEGLNFDLVWTLHLYENALTFSKEMEKFLTEIESYNSEVEFDELKDLKLELAILLLESTVHSLRDLATKALIEFGVYFPENIFENLYRFSNTSRIYIYERLAVITYGICLRLQNDQRFINGVLKANAEEIYNLQFAEHAKAPSFNYIVIDSFKHLIDLALKKDVFLLSDNLRENLKNYQFTMHEDWNTATEDDIEKVRDITVESYLTTGPDPLKMDFVIYTISRLLKNETDFENKLNAVANIYRRILDLGYRKLEFEPSSLENQFFNGTNLSGIEGKIDRLGKKYSWMAYFDYAGYLLNQGNLNVWYPENIGSEGVYQRLSDVRIEASNTIKSAKENRRLYFYDMLQNRGKSEDWVSELLYHTTKDIWVQEFEKTEFSLINGKVEGKVNESYDVRSYMMIEAFFVKREDISDKESLIIGREYDWHEAIDFHEHISSVYFGELYWADNLPEIDTREDSLSIDEKEEIELVLDSHDIAFDERFEDLKTGDKVKKIVDKSIEFEVEPVTIDYSWESESAIFPSLSRKVPSPNIGKFLSLRGDTSKASFLDENNETAIKYYEFKNEEADQYFTYMRSDLLNKYMEEKGFVLIYQIKQHSYDMLNKDNFRGMQFFFPHLNMEV